MNVAKLLAVKGAAVITAHPQDTLATLAGVMATHRIGAIVIVEGEDSIAGIVSERDIVRAIAEKGGAVLGDPASAHMTAKVVTATRTETIQTVMERMTQGRFRHVPIVDDGRLAGIVSIGDVVRQRLEDIEAEASAMRDYIASA